MTSYLSGTTHQPVCIIWVGCRRRAKVDRFACGTIQGYVISLHKHGRAPVYPLYAAGHKRHTAFVTEPDENRISFNYYEDGNLCFSANDNPFNPIACSRESMSLFQTVQTQIRGLLLFRVLTV